MLEGSSPSVPAAGQVEKRGRLHLGQEHCPWGLWAYSRSWDGSGVGSSEFCGGHLGLRVVRNLAVCAQDGFGSLRLDGC